MPIVQRPITKTVHTFTHAYKEKASQHSCVTMQQNIQKNLSLHTLSYAHNAIAILLQIIFFFEFLNFILRFSNIALPYSHVTCDGERSCRTFICMQKFVHTQLLALAAGSFPHFGLSRSRIQINLI